MRIPIKISDCSECSVLWDDPNCGLSTASVGFLVHLPCLGKGEKEKKVKRRKDSKRDFSLAAETLRSDGGIPGFT